MSDNLNSQPMAKNYSATEIIDAPKVRRFLVQPVEISSRRSHGQMAKEPIETGITEEKKITTTLSPKKHLPVPVETSFHSNRQEKNDKVYLTAKQSRLATSPKSNISASKAKPPRKFVPDLIETSKRSKRVEDSRPAVLPTDKTDLTPGVPNIYTSQASKYVDTLKDTGNRNDSSYRIRHTPYKPRRQSSIHPHNNTRFPTRLSTRYLSFTSSLESISSSESGSPSSPTLNNFHSFSSSNQPDLSKDELQRLELSRTRESCDDRFSDYLLALAAKAAQKQLQEQALLAAFPNESHHETVEHFYDREIEATSDHDCTKNDEILDTTNNSDYDKTSKKSKTRKIVNRRSSDSSWAVKEMQMHHDKNTHLHKDEKYVGKLYESKKFSAKGLFWTKTKKSYALPDKGIFDQVEYKKMRNAASPPILGSSLIFRICPSPKPTKFESDQKSNLKLTRDENGGGLWGGFCVAEEPTEMVLADKKRSPLIHTPYLVENFDELSGRILDQASTNFVDLNSKSAGTKESDDATNKIVKQPKRKISKDTLHENTLEGFDDNFVTQVYNYLSLGYPSLAWQFDEELSRISGIPVEELQQDDTSNIRGHIELKLISINKTEASIGAKNIFAQNTDHQRCARWRALKIYILEWGRQNPTLDQSALGPRAWGVNARKGSWAF